MAVPLELNTPFDVAIVGAGIVGASIAHELSPHARVLLIEAEAQPGHHATGRSAALYAAGYGPPQVRALTQASRAFFDAPPPGFTAAPLLRPRGALIVGDAGQRESVQALHDELRAAGVAVQRFGDAAAVQSLVPVLRPEAAACALLDREAADIDVDALLQGRLRAARRHGAIVATGLRIAAGRREGARWRLEAEDGRVVDAGIVVNAAGAWADELAARCGIAPQSIEPRRRSAFTFAPPEGVDTAAWPAVIAADESWYFKPDAGVLLGSPANADPVPPHDVVAEEFDVALGIHRIEQATTLRIARPRSTWAGLRSFAPDGEPVCGFDPGAGGFFWAAALGGYGIQSSPAVGRLAAALIVGAPVPADLIDAGLDVARIAPR